LLLTGIRELKAELARDEFFMSTALVDRFILEDRAVVVFAVRLF
jgi:hypothetical protein